MGVTEHDDPATDATGPEVAGASDPQAFPRTENGDRIAAVLQPVGAPIGRGIVHDYDLGVLG
jgi:hypothetical protein